jgi:Animal haem peroxidase
MVKPFRPGLAERLLGDLFRFVNRRVVWHRLGFLLSVVNLVALRTNLRRFNLYDTETREPEAPKPDSRDVRVTRTPNGSYNDLGQPSMGMAGTRFGRNVPIASTFSAVGSLLDPNPRLISRRLLTRDAFIPASTLNVVAGAWVQFQVHDWFSHGKGASPEQVEPFRISIDEGDPFPQKPLIVPRTRPDPTRGPSDEGRPPTFVNVETHWWDASQIYGSSDELVARVRRDPASGEPTAGGRIHLDPNGLLPRQTGRCVYGEQGELEFTGVNGNWWIGLSALHTLFAREHNLICDRLKIEHPDKDGDWLFEKARLILAALIAKIHTVEWTPALLNTPALRFGMRANWWGILGEEFTRAYGRLGDSEVVSGIIGSPTDHHGVRYSLTEEFVAVYRMHSLMRDDFSFRRHEDNGLIRTATLPDVAAANTHLLYADVPFLDVVYSLGTEHPGALALHNYPRHLQNLRRQDSGEPADLAAVEILRDRERGVPRYCEFRRLLDMKVPETFLELTGGRGDLAREIEAVYGGDLVKVDTMIGMLAEPYPEGFAFSDTAFRIFILMASRRLKSDRFFTNDYTPEVYTRVGLDWIADNTMKTVLLRHLPQLAPHLRDVRNAFFPWRTA